MSPMRPIGGLGRNLFGRSPRQMQRPVKLITGGRHKGRPGGRRRPFFHVGSKAANQRQPMCAKRRQARRESVDMRRSKPHQFDPGGIAKFGVLDDERRERAEIARRRLGRPAHDRVGIALELLEEGPEQAGPCHTAVTRPQDPA